MDEDTVAHSIEYNTAKYFLTLGRLNHDEVCDTPGIKCIFTKNWFNRIFMAIDLEIVPKDFNIPEGMENKRNSQFRGSENLD